jgi:hypothetical protein
VTVRIPLVTQSESNSHQHWRYRQRRIKDQRSKVRMAWLALRPPGVLPFPCVVRLTRVSPRDLDDDNLRGALKGVRDEVAGCMGLPNDRDPRVAWEYAQARGAKGERAVVVEIEAKEVPR